jgi:ArsR family transcriptional regulator, arsenate/arsenite/antimonite-responsive transcriptional repressor
VSTAIERQEVEDAARVFRALGDETRVRIVSLLVQGELCVCHIEEALGCPQSTISRHLAVLRSARIVRTRREGAWVHYSLDREGSPRLVAQLLEIVERFGPVAVPKRRACK